MFSELFVYLCRMKNFIENFGHPFDFSKNDISVFWICRVVNGCVKVRYELVEYDVKAKTIFVVQEGADFKAASASEDAALEVIAVDRNLMNVVYSLLGAEADFGELSVDFFSTATIKKPFSKLMEGDYLALHNAIVQPDIIARPKMMTAVLVHLLLTIFNAVADSHLSAISDGVGRPRQILNRFYELIDENLRIGCKNVAFYASKLCITERYLFKICKSETGTSPKHIINDILLGEIKNALLTTSKTLQQIAEVFGFPDQSSLGQFFRRMTGVAPSEFRENYK